MPESRVTLDASELLKLERRLRGLGKDQLPFAAAATLTDTARAGMRHVREGLGVHFRVRNRGLQNAIQFQPARKRDKPIRSVVHTANWAGFLTLHALGGVKRPERGRKLAVPTDLVRRGASGRVVARHRPRTLTAGPRLVQTLLRARGLIAIRRKRTGIQVFYPLVAQANIKKAWPFQEEVGETVEARLGEFFQRRAKQALETRRP